jgi:biopolymer transport protein ExbB
MLEIFQKGGPMMWLILLASITALGAFLERLVFYHRNTIHTGDFLRGVANLIERNHLAEAVEECATTPGPVAQVAHTVLLKSRAPMDELRIIAREAGQLEIPKLERNLPLLATLAYVTPLLGLLGTCLGLLDAFFHISAQGGYATTAEIAGGVFQSLITSAAALAVAIPSFVCFSYLSARVDGFLRDMERTGIEMVQMLSNARAASPTRPNANQEP